MCVDVGVGVVGFGFGFRWRAGGGCVVMQRGCEGSYQEEQPYCRKVKKSRVQNRYSTVWK